MFLNFQTPSSNYNSWKKVKTTDQYPIITWTEPENIVFMVRNDIRAFIDVNVLADAFNMDKTTLLGNILTVDNFDVYNDDGEKIYDGSNIVGMIADKRWFRIKPQDRFLDTFYNPNNRTMQYYLNNIKMYNFSLFANGVIFATALPTTTSGNNQTTSNSPKLSNMNKDELLNYANEVGADVTEKNTKSEITEAIENKLNDDTNS